MQKRRQLLLIAVIALLVLLRYANFLGVFTVSISLTRTISAPDVGYSKDDNISQTCEFWINKLNNWENALSKGKPKKWPFVAVQHRGGVGDRLAGTITALTKAMDREEKFELQWRGLNSVFEPSLQYSSTLGDRFKIIGGMKKEKRDTSCLKHLYYSCHWPRSDRCPMFIRSCINEKYCSELDNTHGSELSMVNVLGCPLRVALQPTKGFMSSEISWHIDGKVVDGTVQELLTSLKAFTTIAVHIRLGDSYLVRHVPDWEPKQKEMAIFNRSMGCISTVNEKVSSDKPTKWIIASDDERLRNFYRDKFPDKVIVLAASPKHIREVRRLDKARSDTRAVFTEWFLIGSADHLITNHAHGFGISSFSRTAWLYNMKSHYYEFDATADRNTCQFKEFGYEGNIETVATSCRT